MANVVKLKIIKSRKQEGTVLHHVTRLSEDAPNLKSMITAMETKDGKVKLGWTRMDISTRLYLATALLEEIKAGMYE